MDDDPAPELQMGPLSRSLVCDPVLTRIECDSPPLPSPQAEYVLSFVCACSELPALHRVSRGWRDATSSTYFLEKLAAAPYGYVTRSLWESLGQFKSLKELDLTDLKVSTTPTHTHA